MRILMINHFPLTGSGSGTYTRNLAVHLRELGHEVCIILPENTADYGKVPGIKLHPVFFSLADKEDVAGNDPGRSPADPLPFNFPCFTTHPRSVKNFAELNERQLELYKQAFETAIDEEIASFRPDIIHGQHVWILPALAAGKGLPLVLTAHGTDLMGFDKWPQYRTYAQKAMDACSAVISISRDNCQLIEERFPLSKDKIVMMRNGYDPAIFHPEECDIPALMDHFGIGREAYEDKMIVSFVGKLTAFKGVDVLLDAAAIYAKEKPETITLIAGDGEEREKLKKQAEELELRNVHFLGNVDQQILRSIYSSADVDLVPSRREPFGLVAIEAMACGAPVIATDQGGLPDFVNEEVGGLVKVEDAQGLAKKILEVLERKKGQERQEWRQQIASYARNHYAQDTIIQELEELYQKVIKK